jgi:hypothetical protein
MIEIVLDTGATDEQRHGIDGHSHSLQYAHISISTPLTKETIGFPLVISEFI